MRNTSGSFLDDRSARTGSSGNGCFLGRPRFLGEGRTLDSSGPEELTSDFLGLGC